MPRTEEERRKLLEEREAARLARDQASLARALEDHPTEHPHHLTLGLHGDLIVDIECPGHEHCDLWYAGHDGGKCGLKTEAKEVGFEFVEWMVGPEVKLSQLPLPIGFSFNAYGEDEPPEIEWWPLPTTDEPMFPMPRMDLKLREGFPGT